MTLSTWYHPLMMEATEAAASGEPRRIRDLKARLEDILFEEHDMSEFERRSLYAQIKAFDELLSPRLAPRQD